MNFTNMTINKSYVNLDYMNPCMTEAGLKPECVYQNICHSFGEHIISTGFTVMISYIIISWICWLMFTKNVFNLEYETCVFWNNWIRDKVSRFMFGYIALIVLMSII